MLKIIAPVAIVCLLTACSNARTAAPFFFNGSYYMAGDDNCTNVTQVQQGRVVCRNAEGHPTGYRDAMTNQQIQIYQHNQQIAMMQQQQFAAELAQQNAMFAASMQPYQNPQNYLSNYVAPQVMPLQYGGNQIHCITASLYTNCRY